jgi:ribosomal protein S16
MALGGAIIMSTNINKFQSRLDAISEDQEPYYWVVSLWAGHPEDDDDIAVLVGSLRQLVTKKHERATELANEWLNQGTRLSDDRELFVRIEQMAVVSSTVYVKSTEEAIYLK